jgi:hypothetical protein
LYSTKTLVELKSLIVDCLMKNKKIVPYLLVFLFSFFFILFYQNTLVELHIPSSHGDHVITMPLKDKKNLEYLVKDEFIFNYLSYTLFNAKPMSMGCYRKPFFITTDWRRFLSSIFPHNLRLYRAWKTWQKYQHHFSQSRFLILVDENPPWGKNASSNKPVVAILLINKKKFEETVDLHLKDFQIVLKRENISGASLLSEAKDKSLLGDILLHHEGLIGTLFGFGRNNSWLFEEREHGKPVSLTSLWDDEVYASLQIPRSWWWLGTLPDDISQFLGYPGCMVDPNSEETKTIKQRFLDTRQKIIEFYKGKDFLETTLSFFTD